MNRFEYMMAAFKATATTTSEKRLLEIFEQYRDKIGKHYEGCTPEACPWEKWDPKVCSRKEFHGSMFHKGFRQFDVTPSADHDMVVWKILYGDPAPAPAFWAAHAASMADDFDNPVLARTDTEILDWLSRNTSGRRTIAAQRDAATGGMNVAICIDGAPVSGPWLGVTLREAYIAAMEGWGN